MAASDLALEAAVSWFVRLRDADAGPDSGPDSGSDSGPTDGDWLAFETWLRASPANAEAYERLEHLWLDLEDLALVEKPAALPGRRRSARHPLARRAWMGAWIGAGAALAAGLAALAVGSAFWPQAVSPTQTYRAAPGQTRRVALADGTRIAMNAASELSVRLGDHSREVRMAEGEAVFDVAHDGARPFLIAVGDRQVRVVGTEFNLRRRAGRLGLTVRRGLVEVRPVDAPNAAPTRVAVGQELVHAEGEVGQLLRVSDPDAAFAWTSGQLVYRDQPLSEVAADLTRRFAKPVRVADARTAALRFSGVLVTDSEAAVLRRLEAYAPVRAERVRDGIILHHR